MLYVISTSSVRLSHIVKVRVLLSRDSILSNVQSSQKRVACAATRSRLRNSMRDRIQLSTIEGTPLPSHNTGNRWNETSALKLILNPRYILNLIPSLETSWTPNRFFVPRCTSSLGLLETRRQMSPGLFLPAWNSRVSDRGRGYTGIQEIPATGELES